MLFRLKKSAVDKESAKKNFHALETKMIALHNQLSSLPVDFSVDKVMPLRRKYFAYDEALEYLAEKAGINYDESEIGRLISSSREESKNRIDKLQQIIEGLNSDDPEIVRQSILDMDHFNN